MARYLCPTAGVTFSLLPDCLASRLSSTLVAVEEAVVRVEQAPSLEAATDGLRIEVEMPGVLRWLRRRVGGVHGALLAVVTLLPHLLGCAATVLAMREVLGVPTLTAVREVAAEHLAKLPPPVGFGPRPKPRRRTKRSPHDPGQGSRLDEG